MAGVADFAEKASGAGIIVVLRLWNRGHDDLGNILDGSSASLADILSSPRAQAMVKGFECRKATEELCRRCGYAQRFV